MRFRIRRQPVSPGTDVLLRDLVGRTGKGNRVSRRRFWFNRDDAVAFGSALAVIGLLAFGVAVRVGFPF